MSKKATAVNVTDKALADTVTEVLAARAERAKLGLKWYQTPRYCVRTETRPPIEAHVTYTYCHSEEEAGTLIKSLDQSNFVVDTYVTIL